MDKMSAENSKLAGVYTFKKSLEMFERAGKVIPSGIYGHFSPTITSPGNSPYYVAHGKGSRYWDVDGNEIIDWMCAYGPMVLGHCHPEVDAAVVKAMELGNCFNHPTELMVQLAEKLTSVVPIADWAMFAKNGSDCTTWATRVAREYTGKKKILCCEGEYHGGHAWCDPGHGGLVPEDRAHIVRFKWNNLDTFYKAIENNKNDVAGVIMTPFHHPAFGDMEMPAPGWWNAIESTCKKEGIILILDDVRAGFRLHIGSSAEYFGFKPDLVCFCKAIGNTYPLSACVGKDYLRGAANNVFFTGSYWASAMPMAAALVVIDVLSKTDGINYMIKLGEKLMKGLEDLAKSHGLQVKCTGPGSMPFMRFANEENYMRNQLFAAEATKRGAFIHPHHNWFTSVAHTDKDVEDTWKIADQAFKIVKQEFGS